MRFYSTIDNFHSERWELSLPESYLFSYLYTLPSWAEKAVIGNDTYYHTSRNKISSDMPLLSGKDDTIYRYMKGLKNKGLIDLKKVDNKDYVALTDKAKSWGESDHSEINPSKSSKHSEINPTYYKEEKTDYKDISSDEVISVFPVKLTDDTNQTSEPQLSDRDNGARVPKNKVGDKVTYCKIIDDFYSRYPEKNNRGYEHETFKAKNIYFAISENIKTSDPEKIFQIYLKIMEVLPSTFIVKKGFTLQSIGSRATIDILIDTINTNNNTPSKHVTKAVKPLRELTDEEIFYMRRNDAFLIYKGDDWRTFNDKKLKVEQKLGIVSNDAFLQKLMTYAYE